jgi:hypothetical protein
MIPGDTEPRTFANEDILNAFIEADEALQKHDDILHQIFDLINNETITTEQGVTDAWGPLSVAYVSPRELCLNNEELELTAITLSERIDTVQASLNDKQPVITAAESINDAATNAPTDLNVLTTLLGTLTGEVNATNSKQNDLASKFNSLLDRLESQGILQP